MNRWHGPLCALTTRPWLQPSWTTCWVCTARPLPAHRHGLQWHRIEQQRAQQVKSSYHERLKSGSLFKAMFNSNQLSLPLAGILESFDTHHPLELPDEGYQLQLRRPVTDPALREQLHKFKGFITMLSDSHRNASDARNNQVIKYLFAPFYLCLPCGVSKSRHECLLCLSFLRSLISCQLVPRVSLVLATLLN